MLLLGQDFADVLFPLETRKGSPIQPYVVCYKFGWTLSGHVLNEHNATSNTVICNFILSTPVTTARVPDSVPFYEIECLWDLEIEGMDTPQMSVLDREVINLWDQKCRKIEGH